MTVAGRCTGCHIQKGGDHPRTSVCAGLGRSTNEHAVKVWANLAAGVASPRALARSSARRGGDLMVGAGLAAAAAAGGVGALAGGGTAAWTGAMCTGAGTGLQNMSVMPFSPNPQACNLS